MNPSEQRPYQIGISFSPEPNKPWLAAKGPLSVLETLEGIDDAHWANDWTRKEEEDNFLLFPATRLNAMIAEAVATPAAVADEYRQWRRTVMSSLLCKQSVVEMYWKETGAQRSPLLHQVDFIAQLIHSRARGMVNASEQGTGKTMVGWMALTLWDASRALIVCPKSLMREWEREWKALWPSGAPMKCVVLDSGSKEKRRDLLQDIRAYTQYKEAQPVAVILNYEVVHSLEKELLKLAPDALVIDESFRVKNPEADVTRSLIRIADKAEHVLELTGTPIGNHIGDLWSQLRLLGKEAMPEGYHAFLRRYAVLQQLQLGPRTIWKPVGIADPVGLMTRLEPYWYRATKASCLNLPPKRYRVERLPMPTATRELYNDVKKRGSAALGNALALDSEAVVGVRLQQIAGGHILNFCDDGVRMLEVPCPKMRWLQQFAKDRLEGNPTSRCIIWAHYTHELRRITETLGKALGDERVRMCWGETDNEQLEQWKASFQSRAETGVQVLVCQIKKMAFGHNLQACDTNIFFSNSWSYVERSQAEDRSHRNGRADAVEYIDLILQGSIDEDIQAALAKKQDFSGRICVDTTAAKAA